MALNCALLEDVLPSVIHAMSPATGRSLYLSIYLSLYLSIYLSLYLSIYLGCRTMVRLYELLVFLTNINEQQRRERRLPNNDDNYWNEVKYNYRFFYHKRRRLAIIDFSALHESDSTIV